jgi:hypothetical protein
MAFRGEASAVRVSDVQVGSTDKAVAVDDKMVAPADALRVRIAIGFMVVVAAIDCLLYLPRIF